MDLWLNWTSEGKLHETTTTKLCNICAYIQWWVVPGEMFLDAVLHQCGRPADLGSLFSAWNVEAEVFLEERHICSVQSLFEFSLCATDFIPTLIVQLQNGLAH